MGEHYKRASFKVTRAKDVVSVVVDNIRALRLKAPKEKRLPKSVTVTEHNVRKPVQLAVPADTTDVAIVRGKDEKWKLLSYDDWVVSEKAAPTKRPGIEEWFDLNGAFASVPEKKLRSWRGLRQTGPIDDAFTLPFIVCPPTGKSLNENVAKAIDAELARFRREWRRYMMGKVIEYKEPEAFPFGEDPNKCEPIFEPFTDLGQGAILFGDPSSNPKIKEVLPKLPLTWTADKIVIKGREFDAKTHYPVLIYPNPLDPGHYIVINSGMTFGEKEFKASNAMLFPKLGDYAVIEAATGEVKLNGLFDEDWK